MRAIRAWDETSPNIVKSSLEKVIPMTLHVWIPILYGFILICKNISASIFILFLSYWLFFALLNILSFYTPNFMKYIIIK